LNDESKTPRERRHPRFPETIFVRYRKPIAFLLVGLLNTIVGYGLFAILYLVSGLHQAALIVATICGVIFNYFSTGRLVFGSRDLKAFYPFVTGYAVVLGINVVLLELLVWFRIEPLLAQAVCLPLVVVSAYLINSRLVFKS